MILELLDTIATLAISPRRIGPEIRASAGLRARASRCARDWADHEMRCKAEILDVARSLPLRRVAVILGSGLNRDVPLPELSSLFEHVVLVDRQHLASVRMGIAFQRLGNVSLLTRDLSGLAEVQDGAGELQPLAFLADIADVDLVVSANLLSQLVVGARTQLKALPQAIRDAAINAIVKAHVEGLKAAPGARLLISDLSYRAVSRAGARSEPFPLVDLAPFGLDIRAEWDWPVVPFGEIDRNAGAIHQVIAARFEPNS